MKTYKVTSFKKFDKDEMFYFFEIEAKSEIKAVEIFKEQHPNFRLVDISKI